MSNAGPGVSNAGPGVSAAGRCVSNAGGMSNAGPGVSNAGPAVAGPAAAGRNHEQPKAIALLTRAEHAIKGQVWGCKQCGQCVLHSTGLTCPMNCPKTLRNGPCGGVRADGSCEVKPEMRCVWLNAYERSERLPIWRGHIDHLRPPVDNSLQGSSAWINLITGRDRQLPAGWAAGRDVEP